jgi:hypothetical protein
LLAFLLLGGAGGLVALVTALLVGGTTKRLVFLVALGASLAFTLLAIAYLSAPTASEQRPGCSDCYVYWGRWWEPGFVLFIVAANFVAWLVGASVGSGIRAATRRRADS